MNKLWLWVREPLNLAVLVAIGSGLAWLWANFGGTKTPGAATDQVAGAQCGLAVNATGKAIVQISGQPVAPECTPSKNDPAPTPMPSAGGQQAKAAGGVAVNAADGAEVKVQAVPEQTP